MSISNISLAFSLFFVIHFLLFGGDGGEQNAGIAQEVVLHLTLPLSKG